MKKIITLLLLIFVSYSFSQTTQEEYNYLTVGYAKQIKEGLDFKRGYRLDDVSSSKYYYTKNKFREISVKALVLEENGVDVFKGLLLMLQKSTKTNKALYFCVPTLNSSSDLKTQFEDLVYKKLTAYPSSENEFTINSLINFSNIILDLYEKQHVKN